MDFGSCWGQGRVCLLLFLGCDGRVCLEAETVVSDLQNVAAVGKAVEQGGGHLGITEDRSPLAEAAVCGHDGAGAFVELVDLSRFHAAPSTRLGHLAFED